MRQVSEVMKKLGWVMVQFSVLGLTVGALIWLAYTNFTALKISFELAGYDLRPVSDDTLTGPLWEMFGLGELTQAHMFAAAIASVIALLSAIVCHHIYRAARLVIDRREYRASGNEALVSQADSAIIREIVYFSLTMIPLFFVGYWDMQLFRFRCAAPILGFEDSAVAMKDWPLLLEQYGDRFSISLARFGGYAYILLVAGASLCMELWINYVKEAIARLETALEVLWEGAAPAAAEPVQIQPVPEAREADVPFTPVQEPEPAAPVRQAQPVAETVTGTIEWPDRQAEPAYTPANEGNKTEEDEVSVYGGNPGEKVKFSQAVADREHYYIDELKRVWKRSVPEESEAAAEAA